MRLHSWYQDRHWFYFPAILGPDVIQVYNYKREISKWEITHTK